MRYRRGDGQFGEIRPDFYDERTASWRPRPDENHHILLG
jgi:hypothetical protein